MKSIAVWSGALICAVWTLGCGSDGNADKGIVDVPPAQGIGAQPPPGPTNQPVAGTPAAPPVMIPPNMTPVGTPMEEIPGAGVSGSEQPPTMAEMPMAGTESNPPPPVTTSGDGPRIPPMPASCPTIETGMITVKGQQVQLWVGPAGKPGPMVFYWHGTGGRPTEAQGGLGPGLQEVTSQGGVVASFSTTTRTGTNTGNNVWYTGDFEMADEIFACALDQGLVDPRQVYTAGCSAGGLQASAMVYSRSSYLAAAMPNSGGTVRPYPLEEASHVPAMMSTHGAAGVDVVIIDFSQTTATQTRDLAQKGGFVVNCDHGGRHCGSPSAVKAAQWKFLKDHPFGVDPEPYAGGLPAGTPDVCQIIQ